MSQPAPESSATLPLLPPLSPFQPGRQPITPPPTPPRPHRHPPRYLSHDPSPSHTLLPLAPPSPSPSVSSSTLSSTLSSRQTEWIYRRPKALNPSGLSESSGSSLSIGGTLLHRHKWVSVNTGQKVQAQLPHVSCDRFHTRLHSAAPLPPMPPPYQLKGHLNRNLPVLIIHPNPDRHHLYSYLQLFSS